MEKITRHNYEAFFLDYLEGNLNGKLKSELEIFLAQNPDLAKELEEFESESLKPEVTAMTWETLKAPSQADLSVSETLREQLYFRCAEGQANAHDDKLLAEILEIDQFRNEYALWTRLKLTSTGDTVNRKGLYQLPLNLPVTSANYEDFLVARTEGMLSEEESKSLENYASGIEGGEKDLAMADSLKLEAPKGIFYPFKDGLKKKKKGLLFFYRAAAVIVLLGLSASLFFLLSEPTSSDPRYAQREFVQPAPDTLKSIESEGELEEDHTPDETEAEKVQLEEWEIREPDPVYVAESTEPIIENHSVQKTLDIREDLNQVEYAESEAVKIPDEDEKTAVAEAREMDEMTLAEEIPAHAQDKFLTIGEMAQDRVADQLNFSDKERDEMALSVARRITQKAGEALDSELKKEEDEDGDRLTYSLRIGGFKISHSKAK